MLRKYSSVILAVSFFALASSGILMLATHGSASQHLLHPVHIVFGIVMIVAGALHSALNIGTLMSYLKKRPMKIAFAVSSAIMLLLFAVSMGAHD
jgi:p-aminobenzoyl-glutamate transporter AbgT